MKCAHCGAEDPEEFAFCSECGRPRSLGLSRGLSTAVRSAPAPPVPPEAGPAAGQGPQLVDGRTARLVGLEGPVQGQESVLDRAEMHIGRRPGCEIVVPDQNVSRLHTRIRAVPDGYLIEDAGSANGTWVNGVRLSEPQLLGEGDIIKIGTAAFTFQSGGQAAAAPSSPATVVSSLGDETATIDADEAVPAEQRPAQKMERPPQPEPPPGPVEQPGPAAPVAAPGAATEPLGPARDEVVALERDLGLLIEQLNSLSASFSALQGRLARIKQPARPDVPPALRQLSAELEREGGGDRYRELQRLLDELRSDPTDLKLLLRLSEELPAISNLVQAYLRTLSLLREVDEG